MKELLRTVQAAWRDVDTLSVEMEEISSSNPDDRDRKRLLLKRPDRVRLDEPREGGKEHHYVFDGQDGWDFSDGKNDYTRYPRGVDEWGDQIGPLVPLFFQKDPDEILADSMLADETAIRYDMLGEEPCEVIRWKCPGMARNGEAELWIDLTGRPRRYWRAQDAYGVDPTDGLIKPFQRADQAPRFFTTVDYVAVERSTHLPDDLFTVTLPSGAVIDGEAPLATGTPAPDFEAFRLDGGAVRLSDFRGRPVLLNFWHAG